MSNDRELKLLNLCKRLFQNFTGQSLELAKELLTLETEVMAVQSNKPVTQTEKPKEDIPSWEDEKPKITMPQMNVVKPTQKAQIPDDDSDDLPF
jgi:hypothetical protein